MLRKRTVRFAVLTALLVLGGGLLLFAAARRPRAPRAARRSPPWRPAALPGCRLTLRRRRWAGWRRCRRSDPSCATWPTSSSTPAIPTACTIAGCAAKSTSTKTRASSARPSWKRSKKPPCGCRPIPSVQRAPDGPDPAAPTVGLGFASMNYNDGGGSVPPDPEMAAGPNHLVATVNVAVAIYNKNGTRGHGADQRRQPVFHPPLHGRSL